MGTVIMKRECNCKHFDTYVYSLQCGAKIIYVRVNLVVSTLMIVGIMTDEPWLIVNINYFDIGYFRSLDFYNC
jgi:hypothetical protein